MKIHPEILELYHAYRRNGLIKGTDYHLHCVANAPKQKTYDRSVMSDVTPESTLDIPVSPSSAK
jgi:hypothetical protein